MSMSACKPMLRPTTLRSLTLLAAVAALLPPAASAQTHDIGAKVGTSGPGIEYSWGPAAMSDLMPKYAFRANLNWGTYSRRTTRSDVAYRGTIHFRSLFLLADAYPFDNGFRASGGLMINNNRIRAVGVPAGATVNIGGVTYTAAEVGSVNGEVRFERAAPYFGVGWGASPGGRGGLHFSFDFGAIYQRPDVQLVANCGSAVPAARCEQLRGDLEREEVDLRRDLLEGRIYPILNFGVGYRF